MELWPIPTRFVSIMTRSSQGIAIKTIWSRLISVRFDDSGERPADRPRFSSVRPVGHLCVSLRSHGALAIADLPIDNAYRLRPSNRFMLAAGICSLLEQTDLFRLHPFWSAISWAGVELIKVRL